MLVTVGLKGLSPSYMWLLVCNMSFVSQSFNYISLLASILILCFRWLPVYSGGKNTSIGLLTVTCAIMSWMGLVASKDYSAYVSKLALIWNCQERMSHYNKFITSKMACFVNLWLHSRTRIKWVAPRKWWCLPDGGKQEKYEYHCTIGGFHLSAESNSRFALFCFTSLCDWLKNLVPLSRPIRSKLQTVRTCFPALDAGYVNIGCE